MRRTILVMAATSLLMGCESASDHMANVRAAQEQGDKVTVGKVQREIRVGMASSDVVQALGSPNMVTTDEKRRESWVYDKISTESVYSTSSGGTNVLVLGTKMIANALLGGVGGGNVDKTAGAGSTTQRTLTIIVKFDETAKVRDFAYHSSSF